MTEPATRTKTSYVVLRESKRANVGTDALNANAPTYELVKSVDAANSSDAIRQAVGKNEGSYIAVPARSFVPVKVTVTQQTIVKLD